MNPTPWLLAVFVLSMIVYIISAMLWRDEMTNRIIPGILAASMLVALISGWFLA